MEVDIDECFPGHGLSHGRLPSTRLKPNYETDSKRLRNKYGADIENVREAYQLAERKWLASHKSSIDAKVTLLETQTLLHELRPRGCARFTSVEHGLPQDVL